jgi:TRAP-type C4-dicarboxylate transport system permease small subunit
MRPILDWLQARAENVAVLLIAAMFASFVVQIAARYVFNHPLGWTLEACLTTWLWLVLWGCAFVLDDRDHVRFDVLYLAVRRPMRRAFALVSAAAILAGFVASFPAALDYVTFYSIKSSVIMRIRLDVVFSVYIVFALAVIGRYALRAIRLARGGPLDEEIAVPPA